MRSCWENEMGGNLQREADILCYFLSFPCILLSPYNSTYFLPEANSTRSSYENKYKYSTFQLEISDPQELTSPVLSLA
jgi:hypothetical protein